MVLVIALLLSGITAVFHFYGIINRTFLYASAMSLASEIKYLQLQAIIKGKNYLLAETSDFQALLVVDQATQEVVTLSVPFFKNILLDTDNQIEMLNNGNFTKAYRITLRRQTQLTYLNLYPDGRVVVKEGP